MPTYRIVDPGQPWDGYKFECDTDVEGVPVMEAERLLMDLFFPTLTDADVVKVDADAD